MNIVVSTPILESPRVSQVRGIFDLPAEKTSTLSWDIDLPLGERPWNLGLIVGPSGCGKSTIARHLFPVIREEPWPDDRSLLDAFPPEMSIKDVVELLSSVGFSSPPAWLRPYRVLSTGQQFRVTLARLLASANPGHPCVIDEFTSTVDRTVAQIGSAALARTVRKRHLQVVAVTCHEDVEEWLQPDWMLRPAEGLFTWRCLQQRPKVDLVIVRCKASAWPLFAPHHYLSHAIMPSAICFLATWKDRPVAFSAWAPYYGRGPKTRREHRTVTLPDYQGIGIGNALSATIASLWKALGYRAVSTTTHPAMIQARMRSRLWRLRRRPSLAGNRDVLRHASTRLTAGFEYIGSPMNPQSARMLLSL
jgi:ABC-type lipoprotein export system ATPase subunit/GNAT superfamily N-acetyltransferase